MKIRIQNARVMDPFTKEDQVRDLLVQDGLIVEKLDGPADREIDATGCLLAPGFIDAHTHLRDPGFEYREDIITGTRAAARGGYVAVAAMPNTKPVCDQQSIVHYMIEKARREGFCEVLPVAAATKASMGEELAEIGLMKEAGAVGVTDDGYVISTADMMRKVLQYASHFDLPVINHCEEPTMTRGAAMNESQVSTELGLKGMPSASEDIIVARDIILAQYLDVPVHLCHLSTKGAIQLVRRAKAEGIQVSCDCCPHHFSLTDEACRSFDANFKMYPPLREQADVDAVIQGILDGTVDIIATDHAPHHADDEEREFALAANGVIGLETAFPIAYTILHKQHGLPLMDLLACFTTAPAKLFRLGDRSLRPGKKANFTIQRLDQPSVVDKHQMHSKARNTPFHGWEVDAETVLTCWEGRLTYEH